jgi:hypothetical protein
MRFNSLDKYQGRVRPPVFVALAACAPENWGAERIERGRLFFVEGWTQARIGRDFRMSQTNVRNDLIAMLAFWALANGAVDPLREL